MPENQRMLELDVLRGFAVAVMILVVSPGAWNFIWPQLRHADWNGWTFADLVFPDFLFGVGMALGLTFVRPRDRGVPRSAFWIRVGRRVLGLIALGLLLNSLTIVGARLGAAPVGPEQIPELRIPGVLQRIGLCYLLAVCILYLTAMRQPGRWSVNSYAVASAILVILVSYWLLMTLVPVPGYGAGNLGKAGNLAAYLDRTIFTTPHMWRLGSETWRGPVVYDPEGLLSSLPATANVLFGVLAVGIWQKLPERRLIILLLTGVAMIGVALLLNPIFPLNKKIWTSTFVLLTSGFSCLALALAGVLVRTPHVTYLLAPLRILGGNAILAFSISLVFSMLLSIPISRSQTVQKRGFEVVSLLVADPHLASFSFALMVLAIITILIWPLHQRGIHLRL